VNILIALSKKSVKNALKKVEISYNKK
jgi:hypothetical protein